MTDTDGGPAFPQSSRPIYRLTDGGTEVVCSGMSLRDWFAGQALVGTVIAHIMIVVQGGEEEVPAALNEHAAAEANYALADAMLEARDASAPGGKPS